MDEAHCPVCATDVDTTETRCARCHAPYHRECWRYNQGCAIYACRGVRCEGLGLLRSVSGDGEARLYALAFAATLAGLPLVGELVRLVTGL